MSMLDHLPDSTPFIAAAGAVGAQRWNGQRILEAVIIAAITAGATSYAMVKVLDERTIAITDRINRIEEREERRYRELQEDLRRIYGLLVEARPSGRTGR
jgi:phosphate/sulfate permease